MENGVKKPKIFDQWPEKYDRWFETPVGKLIEQFESELIIQMLRPKRGDCILDAGCGTGVFTRHLLAEDASVVGLELSFPMLFKAGGKLDGYQFLMVQGDMQHLPFADNEFDKTISVSAIEFIEDAKDVIDELFRVTKPGGCIVVTTLNRLSPWATRRKTAAKEGHPIFKHAIHRSPDEIRNISPMKPLIKSAIHFQKDDEPVQARKIEKQGQTYNLDTGAFLVARW